VSLKTPPSTHPFSKWGKCHFYPVLRGKSVVFIGGRERDIKIVSLTK
jgi:hypothetical protein